jgi:hypothetical protein
VRKGVLFGTTLAAAALLAGWYLYRRDDPAAAGVAGGAGLGVGAFLLLERFVRGLEAGERRAGGRALLALGALGPAVLALGLLPGSARYVLMGFSCYAGALIITGLLEVRHA